jgi:DNA-binding GntR family transcriptional regulator
MVASELRIVEQKNLTLRIYNNIKQMMFNYDIVPGQRLVFADLAKELNVSRTPVNNALSILAKEGYLDFVPNQGYSVHKLTLEEAKGLYEIKLIFELGTIEKAIQKATPEKIRQLEAKKNAYESSVKHRVDRNLFILDTEFHSAICGMVGNPYVVEQYRDIGQRIFLRFRIEYLQVDRIYEIINEHDKLFKAISNMDVAGAKNLIKLHNEESMQNLFGIIFKNETDKMERSATL